MPDYKKILLVVDLSDDSQVVGERAKAIAACYGSEITLLHVVEYVPVEPMGEALLPTVQIESELVERARKRLAELAAKLALNDARQLVETGGIKTEIIRTAQTPRRRPDRARQPRAPRPGDPAQLHRGHDPARGAVRRARRAAALIESANVDAADITKRFFRQELRRGAARMRRSRRGPGNAAVRLP